MPEPGKDSRAYQIALETFNTVIQPGILNHCDAIVTRLITDRRLVFDHETDRATFARDLRDNLKKLLDQTLAFALVTQFADATQVSLEFILKRAEFMYADLDTRLNRLIANGSEVEFIQSAGLIRPKESLIGKNINKINVNSIDVLISLYIEIIIILILYSFFTATNRRSQLSTTISQHETRFNELNRAFDALQYKEPQETALPTVEVVVDQPVDKGTYVVSGAGTPTSPKPGQRGLRKLSEMILAWRN